jgi:hypothetical protein
LYPLLLLSKAAAARGEFATDDQVRALWAKHELWSFATSFRRLPAKIDHHHGVIELGRLRSICLANARPKEHEVLGCHQRESKRSMTATIHQLSTSDIQTDEQADEALRLAALRRNNILDTSPDGSFDRIAAIAADQACPPLPVFSRTAKRITLVWLGVANGNRALSSAKSDLNHLILGPRLRISNAGRGIPIKS